MWLSMRSTIALNWMIEHHIIYTISGHDHRPMARSATPGTGKMRSHLNGKNRSSPLGVVR
jgi:hypothetical protein